MWPHHTTEVKPVSASARDVARVAGVSISKVSRALAKPDEAEPGTRTLVLGTARGMGCPPDRAAHGQITGRSVRHAMVDPRALGHRRIAHLDRPSASCSNMQRLDALRVVAGQSADTKLIELGSLQPHVFGRIAVSPAIPAMCFSSAPPVNLKSEGPLLSIDTERLGNRKGYCISVRIRHTPIEPCFAAGNLVNCLRLYWCAK